MKKYLLLVGSLFLYVNVFAIHDLKIWSDRGDKGKVALNKVIDFGDVNLGEEVAMIIEGEFDIDRDWVGFAESFLKMNQWSTNEQVDNLFIYNNQKTLYKCIDNGSWGGDFRVVWLNKQQPIPNEIANSPNEKYFDTGFAFKLVFNPRVVGDYDMHLLMKYFKNTFEHILVASYITNEEKEMDFTIKARVVSLQDGNKHPICKGNNFDDVLFDKVEVGSSKTITKTLTMEGDPSLYNLLGATVSLRDGNAGFEYKWDDVPQVINVDTIIKKDTLFRETDSIRVCSPIYKDTIIEVSVFDTISGDTIYKEDTIKVSGDTCWLEPGVDTVVVYDTIVFGNTSNTIYKKIQITFNFTPPKVGVFRDIVDVSIPRWGKVSFPLCGTGVDDVLDTYDITKMKLSNAGIGGEGPMKGIIGGGSYRYTGDSITPAWFSFIAPKTYEQVDDNYRCSNIVGYFLDDKGERTNAENVILDDYNLYYLYDFHTGQGNISFPRNCLITRWVDVDVDYDISYLNNVEPGWANFFIHAKGKWTGDMEGVFLIVRAPNQ